MLVAGVACFGSVGFEFSFLSVAVGYEIIVPSTSLTSSLLSESFNAFTKSSLKILIPRYFEVSTLSLNTSLFTVVPFKVTLAISSTKLS